jgi:hypothetical protein
MSITSDLQAIVDQQKKIQAIKEAHGILRGWRDVTIQAIAQIQALIDSGEINDIPTDAKQGLNAAFQIAKTTKQSLDNSAAATEALNFTPTAE